MGDISIYISIYMCLHFVLYAVNILLSFFTLLFLNKDIAWSTVCLCYGVSVICSVIYTIAVPSILDSQRIAFLLCAYAVAVYRVPWGGEWAED